MFERMKAFLWGALMIAVGVASLIWSGTTIVTAADIAQNGKVTTAKVISSRMETRRSGRRSVRIVYVHQVQFDGKRAAMDLVAPRPDGAVMKVIYLKSNPGDPRVFVSRDWGDVLGWSTFNWLLALALPAIFIIGGAGWLIVAFRRGRRSRRAAVVVTPPQAAMPDPYPPTPAAYPPPGAQYPGAAPNPYGAPSGQYPQAPAQYPPASGQYQAQPGQYPPAPPPGSWPPVGQGGGYPPGR